MPDAAAPTPPAPPTAAPPVASPAPPAAPAPAAPTPAPEGAGCKGCGSPAPGVAPGQGTQFGILLHRWLGLTWYGYPRPAEKAVRKALLHAPLRLAVGALRGRLLRRRWWRVARRLPRRTLPGCGCWVPLKDLWEARLKSFLAPHPIPTRRETIRPAPKGAGPAPRPAGPTPSAPPTPAPGPSIAGQGLEAVRGPGLPVAAG